MPATTAHWPCSLCLWDGQNPSFWTSFSWTSRHDRHSLCKLAWVPASSLMRHKHLPPGGFGENSFSLPQALWVPLKPGAQVSAKTALPLGLITSSALSNTPGPSYFQSFTRNSFSSRLPWGVPSDVMETSGCHRWRCLAQEANNQFRRSRCELLKCVNCCLWSPDSLWSCPISTTTKWHLGGLPWWSSASVSLTPGWGTTIPHDKWCS